MKFAFWILTLSCVSASAEVVDSSSAGFLLRSKVTIAASPEQVYDGVVRGVGKWWQRDHTWSGESKNLSITPKAGGCFCERLPPSGEVQHMQVVYVQPGKLLRMTGALGPLQASGISGTLTFEFAPAANGATDVTLSYSAGGYFEGGIQALAAPVDGVLTGQLASLKKYLELK